MALLSCASWQRALFARMQDAFKHLHLSERGYKALAYCLYPRLKQLLGPRLSYDPLSPPMPPPAFLVLGSHLSLLCLGYCFSLALAAWDLLHGYIQ